mmetsp:Transcript_22044/g.32572  ORF Transcript_22044/g.32572 Transcript_22044/m.32572 type:complete len:127 (+) Transcript_22044:59-439(+)
MCSRRESSKRSNVSEIWNLINSARISCQATLENRERIAIVGKALESLQCFFVCHHRSISTIFPFRRPWQCLSGTSTVDLETTVVAAKNEAPTLLYFPMDLNSDPSLLCQELEIFDLYVEALEQDFH